MTSFVILSQVPAKAASIQYEDVVKSDPAYGYAYDSIYYLTDHGIINGYVENGHNLFKPGDDLTRTQAAIMLVKALGQSPLPDDSKPYFPDVNPNTFAYGYIQKSYELGIFSGHEDGSFGPGERLTRLQMAHTLVNAFKLMPVDKLPSQFKDINEQSLGFADINALYYYGISDGSNGQYMPSSNIKRAQFSVFVARGMNTSFRIKRTKVVASGQVHVDAGSTLNVRQSPDANSQILGSLNNYAVFNITNQIGDWFQINYNGATGYVTTEFVTVGPPYNPNAPLAGRIIVLDPGHGGGDPGAMALDGTEEQAINYGFGLHAKSALEQAGATVVMTHGNNQNCMTGTYSQHPELQCRVDVAANSHADIFISIHSNAGASTASGTETYYNDFNDPNWPGVNDYPVESKQLATIIQSTVPSAIGMKDGSVHDNNLYVTRMNTVPAVLIELGYLTNQADLARLESRTIQEYFGTALKGSVIKYFNNLTVSTPSAPSTGTTGTSGTGTTTSTVK